MKHKQLHLILMALGTVLGALIRFWNLSAAVDELGLFITNHPASLSLIGVGILFVLIFGFLSFRSPGRGVDHRVLTFSAPQSGISLAAAILLLLGALWALPSGGTVGNLLLTILGLAAAVAMILLSRMRKNGNQASLPELLPVIFLLVNLILNFKSWSTDPVILDYCDMLFAQIFTLLAFYGIAGFSFDQGHPRRTLFYGSCGIFFSAMAAVDSIMESDLSTAVIYLSFMISLWPVVQCLLTPRHAPPKPISQEKPEGKNE